MALKKVRITENQITMLRNFKVYDFSDAQVGFDKINPYGGNYLYTDLAMIFGFYDKMIPETKEHFFGPSYPDEYLKPVLAEHYDLMRDIEDVESIIHQFAGQNFTAGTYKCINRENIWIKDDK